MKTVVDEQVEASVAAPARARRPAGRTVLEWFGVDVTGATLPVDPSRTCLDGDCQRRAMVGELVCPVHLGLVTAAELPDHRGFAAHRKERLLRTAVLAALVILGGAGLGVAVGDLRFGWLGGVAGAAVVAGHASRELHFDKLASLLGMLAFFAATVLVFAGFLVGTISALPWLIGHLLG
ncbi:hypothetical protein [Vulgatibacter incomptus]|uniref:hypothetical protein n=1 Tax=Vulgatibacter incomptus TaxID=1391653 RepID=UPI0012FB7160|nr:hypothetical protein [Vulgatibacter incomptus]